MSLSAVAKTNDRINEDRRRFKKRASVTALPESAGNPQDGSSRLELRQRRRVPKELAQRRQIPVERRDRYVIQAVGGRLSHGRIAIGEGLSENVERRAGVGSVRQQEFRGAQPDERIWILQDRCGHANPRARGIASGACFHDE